MEEEASKKKQAAEELRETMQQRIDLLTQKLKASEESKDTAIKQDFEKVHQQLQHLTNQITSPSINRLGMSTSRGLSRTILSSESLNNPLGLKTQTSGPKHDFQSPTGAYNRAFHRFEHRLLSPEMSANDNEKVKRCKSS